MNASRRVKRLSEEKKGTQKELKELDKKKIIRCVADVFLIILLPVLCFYLLESYSHNPFTEVRPWAQFFNI